MLFLFSPPRPPAKYGWVIPTKSTEFSAVTAAWLPRSLLNTDQLEVLFRHKEARVRLFQHARESNTSGVAKSQWTPVELNKEGPDNLCTTHVEFSDSQISVSCQPQESIFCMAPFDCSGLYNTGSLTKVLSRVHKNVLKIALKDTFLVTYSTVPLGPGSCNGFLSSLMRVIKKKSNWTQVLKINRCVESGLQVFLSSSWPTSDSSKW